MNYPYDLVLSAELNRNRVYDAVITAIERAAREDGITQSKIAEIIGRKRPQISAWLAGPSNWTLDTTSFLLTAIGATMEYNVAFYKDHVAPNAVHPASLPAGQEVNLHRVAMPPQGGTNVSIINTVKEEEPCPTTSRSSQSIRLFPGSGTRNSGTYIQT